MRSAVEVHQHFPWVHGDGGGHVDQISKDAAGLGVNIAAHFSGEQSVKTAGHHQERHVEVHLDTDRRGECSSMFVEDGLRQADRVYSDHGRRSEKGRHLR